MPVRFGNHAAVQRQLDALGYLADCAHIYLKQGGTWKPRYWDLMRSLADYTLAHWRKPDSGIWELAPEQHYVSSKVMSWVVLDRAVRIARHLGHEEEIDHWRAVMAEIQSDVLEHGWSPSRNAFRQRYEADALDASVLLMPVMGFLPADHPQVVATVEQIETALMRDGLVYRFEPEGLEPAADLAPGSFEGAFLPCTFWLAATYAMLGQSEKAEAILVQVEAIAGSLGLMAEEADGHRHILLGNTPLLFAQVEYIRAIMELAKARPTDMARMMVGQVQQRIGRFFDSN